MVFLSLAARYFDCMCSTPKSPAGPLIGSEVAAAKLELGAARAAPRSKRPRDHLTRGTAGGRDLSASAREGSDWMAPSSGTCWPPQIPSILVPCPFLVWGNTLVEQQGLPSPFGLRWVDGLGWVVERQGFRGTEHLPKVPRHAWMIFDCRLGVLQYLANLITAT